MCMHDMSMLDMSHINMARRVIFAAQKHDECTLHMLREAEHSKYTAPALISGDKSVRH